MPLARLQDMSIPSGFTNQKELQKYYWYYQGIYKDLTTHKKTNINLLYIHICLRMYINSIYTHKYILRIRWNKQHSLLIVRTNDIKDNDKINSNNNNKQKQHTHKKRDNNNKHKLTKTNQNQPTQTNQPTQPTNQPTTTEVAKEHTNKEHMHTHTHKKNIRLCSKNKQMAVGQRYRAPKTLNMVKKHLQTQKIPKVTCGFPWPFLFEIFEPMAISFKKNQKNPKPEVRSGRIPIQARATGAASIAAISCRGLLGVVWSLVFFFGGGGKGLLLGLGGSSPKKAQFLEWGWGVEDI